MIRAGRAVLGRASRPGAAPAGPPKVRVGTGLLARKGRRESYFRGVRSAGTGGTTVTGPKSSSGAILRMRTVRNSTTAGS